MDGAVTSSTEVAVVSVRSTAVVRETVDANVTGWDYFDQQAS
jgi:hypothetical protein